MPAAATCPDPETLRSFATGRLTGAEADAIEHHLVTCVRCPARLAGLTDGDPIAGALRTPSPELGPSERAALAVLIGRVKRLPEGGSLVETPGDSSRTRAADPGPGIAPETAPVAFGRYRVVGRVGAGGMGAVFLAEDPQFRRRVAVKVPHFRGPAAAREAARARFLREARAAAAVRHPHLCPVYDMGEEGGTPYVVMAYVEGESLADRLKREGQFANTRRAAELAAQVADALTAVHAAGIVHRDLKPGNVLLDRDGRPHLTDFGLAHVAADGEPLTSDGALLGTPAYMAPEQASLGLGPVTPRTDVYSLGVVLYHLLSGRLPFEGSALQVVNQVAAGVAPPRIRDLRPDLDPGLAAVVEKAMSRDPARRYATATEMAVALRDWLDGSRAARPAAPAAAPKGRRPRWVGVAAAAGLLAGAVALGQIVIRYKDEKGQPKEVVLPKGSDPQIVVPPGEDPPTVVLQPGAKDPAAVRPPLPPVAPGEPIGLYALVGRPAKLPGVRSWTVDTAAPRGAIHQSAFRPDGRRLAVITQDAVVRIWDVADGRLVRALPLPGYLSGTLRTMAWSPDGKTIALVGTVPVAPQGRVVLLDDSTGRTVGEFDVEGPLDPAWSPDSKYLAFASGWSAVAVWDVAAGRRVSRLEVRDKPNLTLRPAWSPDGKTIAAAHAAAENLQIYRWEVATTKELPPIRPPGPVNPGSLAWSPDGTSLAFKGGRGKEGEWAVHVWDAGPGRVRTLEGTVPPTPDVAPVVWLDGGRRVASDAVVWDAATGKADRALPLPPPQPSDLDFLLWSPDGKTVAEHRGEGINTAGWSVRITLRDAATGARRADLPDGHENVNARLAWVPGDGLAFRGGVWDAATGERRRDLRPEDRAAAAWSPDSRHYALPDEASDVVTVYALEEGVPRKLFECPGMKGSTLMDWSPDGKRLGVMGTDALGIWDVPSGKQVRSWKAQGHGSRSIDLSPDGESLVVAGGWVVLYSPGSEEGRPLPGATSSYLAVWSPDGKTVRTIESTGKVTAWDVATHQVVRTGWVPFARGLVSLDQRTVIGEFFGGLRIWSPEDGRPLGAVVPLRGARGLTVSPEGHYRGPGVVERDLIYIVETDDGSRVTLTPEEFAKRYGWKNDPDRVRLR